MPRSKVELTAQEKRNVELVKDWAKAWATDAARMVDEVYADSTEVFTPQQNIYMQRKGKSKANWKALEVVNQHLYKTRKMKFVTIVPKGDTVAVEFVAIETNLRGKARERRDAAFLKFDKDGRVVSDHTYMIGSDITPDPERAHDPKIKKLMEALRDAHQKIMAEK